MSVHKAFLYDLGLDVKQRALEARRRRDAMTEGTPQREFESGRVIAFNEVISMMQQNAEGLGIPLADLRLDDIDPDSDLV